MCQLVGPCQAANAHAAGRNRALTLATIRSITMKRRSLPPASRSFAPTSHCFALKKVEGPTGGPSAGGTMMRRCCPARMLRIPSSNPAHTIPEAAAATVALALPSACGEQQKLGHRLLSTPSYKPACMLRSACTIFQYSSGTLHTHQQLLSSCPERGHPASSSDQATD